MVKTCMCRCPMWDLLFSATPKIEKCFQDDPGCYNWNWLHLSSFPTLSILSGCYTWHFSEKSPRWEVRTTRRSFDPQNPIPPLTRSDRTGGWSSGGRCFLAEGLGPCQGIYILWGASWTFRLNPIEWTTWQRIGDFQKKSRATPKSSMFFLFFPHTKTIQRLWGSDGVSLHLGLAAWQPGSLAGSRSRLERCASRLRLIIPWSSIVLSWTWG